MAGTISVPRSIHRIRTVDSGRGTWKRMKKMNGKISGIFDERVYAIDFFKLSKISLPSSTPFTIELKLSSSKSISAFLIAGESLTPSPVTATTCPAFWHASTISNFYDGVVLAKTTSGFAIHSYKNCPLFGSFSERPSSAKCFSANKSP